MIVDSIMIDREIVQYLSLYGPTRQSYLCECVCLFMDRPIVEVYARIRHLVWSGRVCSSGKPIVISLPQPKE